MSDPDAQVSNSTGPTNAADQSHDLLPAVRAARLERVSLRTHRPVAGALAGQHGSPRRGSSLDFADHRQYTDGDDFRRIDHNLLARLDQLVIKLFDADDDLTVHVLLDDSASMSIGGKLRRAQELIAAIGFVTLRRRDTIVLHTLHGVPRRCSGANGMPTLLAALEQTQPIGETDLILAVDRFLGAKGPGLMLIVSDFLTADWEKALRTLPTHRREQGVAIHVLHPDEINPQLSGDLELIDIETGDLINVSLNPDSLEHVRTHIDAWMTEVKTSCRRLGFDYSVLMATDDLDEHLDRQWRSMELLK
jgi:uncharacterized protein (DUF58 family)